MLTTPVQRITGTCTRGTRVSSSPSKIPYGGFSPVRLQTGIPPRPSPARSRSSRYPVPAYTRRKFLSPKRASRRSRTLAQAALPSSDRTLPSRGPWLVSGFYCPAGSMLTMTSSETLAASGAAYDFAVRCCPRREVPQFTLPVCPSVPPSVPRQTERLRMAVSSSLALAFPISVEGRHLQTPRAPVPAWLCNEAAKFTLWYGPVELLARHRPGRLLSSLHPRESPPEGVEYHYAGKSANSRGRTCTGKTSSLMGCEQRPQRKELQPGSVSFVTSVVNLCIALPAPCSSSVRRNVPLGTSRCGACQGWHGAPP